MKNFNNHVLDDAGNPVSIDNKEAWGKARVHGVSASDINKIVSPTLKVSIQQEKLLKQKLGLAESLDIPNSYTDHGNEREPIVLEWAQGNFSVEPNKYLYHGENPQHFATPDGLGEDFVVEVKTSIKPLAEIRQGYMNQMQWQMHVMGVKKCLFLVEVHDKFKPLSIDYEWVEYDEDRIKFILEHVDAFIKRLNEGRKN